jgi:hypothetical protein
MPLMTPPKMPDEAHAALMEHLARYTHEPDDEVDEEA